MTYLLQIMCAQAHRARIGMLGGLRFRKGTYLYVGSAKRGLRARIRRHLSRKKKVHWHIDRFLALDGVRIKKVWIHARAIECRTARRLEVWGHQSIDGFGSSDCRCKSHMFIVRKGLDEVRDFLRREGFRDADKSCS